jgi:hypothetical protein
MNIFSDSKLFLERKEKAFLSLKGVLTKKAMVCGLISGVH